MMEYIEVISNVGFPIFIGLYFILKTEKVIKANSEVVKENTKALTKVSERL
jgi:hypothetical protein